MKKAILWAMSLALAIGFGLAQAAGDDDAVHSKVRRIADQVGADLSALDRELPNWTASRSLDRMTLMNRVDATLVASEEAAIAVAARRGVVFPLHGYKGGSLAGARAALQSIHDKVASAPSSGKDREITLNVQAGELLRAAAIVRGARLSPFGWSERPFSVSRSLAAESEMSAKLAFAGLLADRSAEIYSASTGMILGSASKK